MYKGRPAKYTKNNARVRVALEEFAKGNRPVREICELYGISRVTLYRVAEKEGIQRGNHS
ncbi:helix-turn-helix domain-containing protein [Kroppenstedtia eburnea]|uniref:helix-turn-helix domain-containing protein n=1 Tax=Kroppenstedtia eburnea TaxID=714067 RepID=UPI00363A8F3B